MRRSLAFQALPSLRFVLCALVCGAVFSMVSAWALVMFPIKLGDPSKSGRHGVWLDEPAHRSGRWSSRLESLGVRAYSLGVFDPSVETPTAQTTLDPPYWVSISQFSLRDPTFDFVTTRGTGFPFACARYENYLLTSSGRRSRVIPPPTRIDGGLVIDRPPSTSLYVEPLVLPLTVVWKGLLLNIASISLIICTVWWLIRFVTFWRRMKAGACQCGYSLISVERASVMQCPECGRIQ